MTDPYESLANAIILLAVKDYRLASKKLKYHPKALTTIDGESLLRKLQEEY